MRLFINESLSDDELWTRSKAGDKSILSDPRVASLKNEWETTPLHRLARLGITEVLKHPQVSKVSDRFGWTPLHRLAYTGAKEVLKHRDVNKVEDRHGNTPLHYFEHHDEEAHKSMGKPESTEKHVKAIMSGMKSNELALINTALIRENLGALKKQLGCGADGCAYLSTNNKVLKFTFNKAEVSLALKFHNKKLKTFPTVYRVIDLLLDGHHVSYVIELEKINGDLTGEQIRTIRLYNLIIDQNHNVDFVLDVADKGEFNGIKLNNNDVEFLQNVVHDIEMAGVHQTPTDAHHGNFKSKNGNLVFIDLGQGYHGTVKNIEKLKI